MRIIDRRGRGGDLAFEEIVMQRVRDEPLDSVLHWLASEPRVASLRPRALDELAYQLWILERRLPEAIKVFELNLRVHAEWPQAALSLADARAAAASP